MKKKGIFFSFICFLLLVLLIIAFSSPKHLELFYRQPVQEQRAYALNGLFVSFDRIIIPDILRVASIQTLLVATQKVTENGYFSLTEKTRGITRFEHIVQGEEFAQEMKEKNLAFWIQKYRELAKQEYHAELAIRFSDIYLTQISPWKLNVHATAQITLTAQKMQWAKKNTFIIEIPIIGLPDPLWAGQGIRVLINDTLSKGMKTEQILWKGKDKNTRFALLQAAIQQRAFFHPLFPAPSYLSRFEGGKQTDATTGIFAFADRALQNAQKNSNPGSLRTSYLDYKFVQPNPSSGLSYIVGISDVDGQQEDYVPNRKPPLFYQEFHIFGMTGRKKTSDGFRFKLDMSERAFFGFDGEGESCKDEINDNTKPTDPLPIFPTDNKECYQLVQKLASVSPPKAVLGAISS